MRLNAYNLHYGVRRPRLAQGVPPSLAVRRVIVGKQPLKEVGLAASAERR